MDNLLMVQQDKDDNDDGYITINKKDIDLISNKYKLKQSCIF